MEKYRLALDTGAGFNPRLAFGSHSDADHIYNTPRAWFMGRYFMPRTCKWEGENADFTPESNDIPWSFVPERKVTVEDVRYLLGSYYQGTPYNPYDQTAACKGRYRTIGVPNSDVCGIMQIRGGLPAAIQGVEWLSMGGSGFTGLLPGLRECDGVSQVSQRYHRNGFHKQHVLAQPAHCGADRCPLRECPAAG